MDIEFALAEYAVGLLPSESAPGIALALLEAGHDGSALAEIATMNKPAWRDARELFEEAVRSTGYRIPSVQDGQQIIVAVTLSGLSSGAIEPRVGAGRLWELWNEFGGEQDLSYFVALADDWDDHPSERKGIEGEIVSHAAKLRDRYPRRAV